MRKFLWNLVKCFNYAIDVFIIYILLFGHMSGTIFGKSFETDGFFVWLFK